MISPRNPKRKIHSARLTDGEVHQLLDGCGEACSRALTHLAVHTGLRAGEIRQLRWAEVDLADGVLHVLDRKAGNQIVAFPQQLAAELETWRSKQEAHARRYPRLAEALASSDTAYIFLTPAGRPVSAVGLARRFAVWSACACGRAVKLYDVRRWVIATGGGPTNR